MRRQDPNCRRSERSLSNRDHGADGAAPLVTSVSFASPPESLLIVRLGAMGDVIHTLYAVSALRAVFPELRLGWAIEEAWAELLCAHGTDRSGPRTPSRPVV